MKPSAKVIADTTYKGVRVTTLEIVFHRFVLAELNTHRRFSRNSASSRAIPITKMLKRALRETAYPVEWGSNKSGMQAGAEIKHKRLARFIWKAAATCATVCASLLYRLGVHKQITNRLLEPFLWHTAVVTSTEWDNFFDQRISPLAQPEIHALAREMKAALDGSTPVEDHYHTPYADPEAPPVTRMIQSVARCARVSTTTHGDSAPDTKKDAALFLRLYEATPPHWSPFEHAAYALQVNPSNNTFPASNFDPQWVQLRHADYMMPHLVNSAKKLRDET